MVRGRDACWEHCVLIDATRQKVRCNYCHREFSGGVYRMKFHLAQLRNKDIVPCTEVPGSVRDQILSMVSTPKKQKTTKKMKLDQVVHGQEDSSSASAGVLPNLGSSGQDGSSSPLTVLPHPSPSDQAAVDDSQSQKQEVADKKIAAFFVHSSVPFSAAKSIYYQEMLDAIADCGVGYIAPTYDKLRCTLLQKIKCDLNARNDKLRDEWKVSGCTILFDSWSDGRGKSLVVISVTCPKGTLYWRSTRLSGREQEDAHYIYQLLDIIVQELGVRNVVQVITDSAPAWVYAGSLLMDQYPSLFWSPCASRCMNNMLEDLSKQDWVNTVLTEASKIVRFLHHNEGLLGRIKIFTGGRGLIRPKLPELVSNFLSLRSLVLQEDNIQRMFSHSEWSKSNYFAQPEAEAIRSLVYLPRFWTSAREVVSVSEPLIKILRIVDGDIPAMGYIYEGIERAKNTIKSYYKGREQKSQPMLEIIDRRWSMLICSPLHAAAAFLNPSVFYSLNFKTDAVIRNGFQEAMTKMATEDSDKIEITKEHPAYVNAQGALGTEFAIKGRTLNSPGDWWSAYGYEIPMHQKYAVRILSQPCSSLWCRWNWSTFESKHNKTRSQIQRDKFDDLVFVQCNLRLQALVRSINTRCEPIYFDDIDVTSEWPTEAEAPPTVLDESWLDNLPSGDRWR